MKQWHTIRGVVGLPKLLQEHIDDAFKMSEKNPVKCYGAKFCEFCRSQVRVVSQQKASYVKLQQDKLQLLLNLCTNGKVSHNVIM